MEQHIHAEGRLAIGRRLLGRRLRELRTDSGLTLKEVAARTDLTVAHISDCERGRRLPSIPSMLSLADLYAVLVSDLVSGIYPFGTTQRPRTMPAPPPDARTRRH
jgi:transcriptional regulator with XRE-family HTH domain